jgi:flagellar FliJ protein
MKKFKFGLQKILKLRQWNENDAKLDLGRSVSALNEIENNLKANAVKQVEASANQFSNSETSGNMQDFRIYANYLKYLETEKENLIQEAAKAEAEVEAKREQWAESKAEVKVMENLKDRRFTEYKKYQLKAAD